MPARLYLPFAARATRIACVSVVLGAAPSPARAAPAQGAPPFEPAPIVVDFKYRAVSTCPDLEHAFSLLSRRSGRVRRGDGEEQAQQLSMVISADHSGYRGVLTVIRPGEVEERRSVVGPHCAEVVEALALTAALSIDPDATLTLGPASDEERSRDHEAATSTWDAGGPLSAGAQDAAGAPSAAAAPPRVALGASLMLEKLMTHALHLGGGAVLSVSRAEGRVLLPLEARVSIHVLAEANRGAQPRVATRFLLSRLAYCPVRLGDQISLLLCPVSELGAVTAESDGLAEDERRTRWFATLGLEGWLRVRSSRHWELWLSPALTVPLTERRFAADPGPDVLTSTVDVVWGVSAGIGWTF